MQGLKFPDRSKTDLYKEMDKADRSQLLEKSSESARGPFIKIKCHTFIVAGLFACTFFVIIWVYASQENENSRKPDFYDLVVEKWPSYESGEEKETLNEVEEDTQFLHKDLKQSVYNQIPVKQPEHSPVIVKQPASNPTSVKRPLLNPAALKIPTYKHVAVGQPDYEPKDTEYKDPPHNASAKEELQCTSAAKNGNGYQFVFFLQTAYSSPLPVLAACAIESAARVYKSKTIRFYIKALNEDSLKKPTDLVLQFLKSLERVEVCPLDPDLLLKNTPLQRWYTNADPAQETFWTHVQSDAFRYAVLWQFGGLYLDTDVITFKPVPDGNFLGYQSSELINGAVLSSKDHSAFMQSCMEDFVDNYQGAVWGQQGPQLLTRVLHKLCNLSVLEPEKDFYCESQDVTVCKQASFYSIPYQNWKAFYSPSRDMSVFRDSYAAHVWNQMNQWSENEKLTMRKGDDTLLTNMFRKYCPHTYDNFV
ncbi:alpha-1,4-N-acetylglucosaminyltransferase-like [Protopterus annectens]|uniref:alpha-1,4-N-acetylglucosaminyltransferase-like n=1 Tax=Protopterus annectens TaxID=7888 RepID=UPI001CFA6692|nr:alpha-1,4-N-acetylglucosaminyltransferase-like [Protopterus annectens]